MSQKKFKDEPAPKAEAAKPEARRQPAKVIRVEDVSASIWTRQHLIRGEPTTFYSVTPERSYKDRDGARCYTKSYDPDSLGALVAVIQQADAWIRERQAEPDARPVA